MNRKSPKRIWQEEAKRQGICIGIEKLRDAALRASTNIWVVDRMIIEEEAAKLLAKWLFAEQEEK